MVFNMFKPFKSFKQFKPYDQSVTGSFLLGSSFLKLLE